MMSCWIHQSKVIWLGFPIGYFFFLVGVWAFRHTDRVSGFYWESNWQKWMVSIMRAAARLLISTRFNVSGACVLSAAKSTRYSKFGRSLVIVSRGAERGCKLFYSGNSDLPHNHRFSFYYRLSLTQSLFLSLHTT